MSSRERSRRDLRIATGISSERDETGRCGYHGHGKITNGSNRGISSSPCLQPPLHCFWLSRCTCWKRITCWSGCQCNETMKWGCCKVWRSSNDGVHSWAPVLRGKPKVWKVQLVMCWQTWVVSADCYPSRRLSSSDFVTTNHLTSLIYILMRGQKRILNLSILTKKNVTKRSHW